jgi:hypothetical protein
MPALPVLTHPCWCVLLLFCTTGADIWDPATETYVGRYNSMGQNTPFLPINQPLFDASTSGGYYPGAFLNSKAQTCRAMADK